jgi:ribonuclease HI
LTSASLAEWTTIHSLLSIFCAASGLEINLQKSVFLTHNAQEPFLSDLKELFGFATAELKEGFSYLGFYIKSSRYSSRDWLWLIDKFERRILLWCNKLLSLGGRLILIKVVLESLPVYWMALAHIPVTVLRSLRQLIFSFLWSGSNKSSGYHLCNWEVLSKPKLMGGWGLRNLPFFYRALSANTLWRILMKPGFWNKVIKAKYFPHLPVHLWIRSAMERPSNASQTWRHLLKSLPIILHWLSWNPGNGYSIEIGRDALLGLGGRAFLSTQLLTHLHNKSIFFLHQISTTSGGHLGDSWISNVDLALDRDLAIEWDEYTRRLTESDICLQDRSDTFLWTGGDRSGNLTTKNVYRALANKCWTITSDRWRQKIWRGDCSLKIKLFAWLLFENKLLMWSNLQSRGWVGPGRCTLCKSHSESVAHVFINCTFFKSVWLLISPALSPGSTWAGPNIPSCFQNWIKNTLNPALLPISLCWQIWKTRNEAIFEDKTPLVHRVANYIIAELASNRNQTSFTSPSRPIFIVPHDRIVAWFDGAAQQSGSLCGAGGKLVLNSHTCFRWTLNCGTGSNMKAELLGAWASLILASRLHVNELLLLGDSKITIDWLNGLADFQVADLKCWKERTRAATKLFNNLTFSHIYREQNIEANILSKKAMFLPSGQIRYTRWEEGNEGPSTMINL